MDCTAHVEGNVAKVKLSGRFTFEARADFQGAVLPLLTVPGLQEVRLDLEGLNYLDASALGLLLTLRERAQSNGQRIVLERPRREVRAILDFVKFDRIFTIVD